MAHEKSPALSDGANLEEHPTVSGSDSIPATTYTDWFRKPALWWAEHNFAILPLEPFGKRPFARLLGKFGSFESVATTSSEQVEKWWSCELWKANIGVATGAPSGIVVIDIDGPEGYEALRQWEFDNDCYLPGTFTVKTPSGGRHYWFELPEDSERVPSPTGWLPKVDVRADGAMVAAPPSVRRIEERFPPRHGDPRNRAVDLKPIVRHVEYTIQSGHPMCLATAPDALLADIRRSPGVATSHTRAEDLPTTERFIETGLPIGSRNETMHRLACRLFRKYGLMKVDLVYDVCRLVWERTPDHHTFTWAEAENAVLSAETYMRRVLDEEDRA